MFVSLIPPTKAHQQLSGFFHHYQVGFRSSSIKGQSYFCEKMSKYGLNIRTRPSKQVKQTGKLLLPRIPGFGDDDDGDVNQEIVRQATRKQNMTDVEEQHRKALEEDPSVFDYDGVYEQMKGEAIRPLVRDKEERKPKYIEALLQKTKLRQQEHDIIYERKIAKERSVDDHLYADKDKFVTGAYKRKLAEQAKWEEEERLRELREKRENVPQKGGMTDFYFNLSKNVAFGAKKAEPSKPVKQGVEATKIKAEKELCLTSSPNRTTTCMEKEADQPFDDLKKTDKKLIESDQSHQPPLDDGKKVCIKQIEKDQTAQTPLIDQAKLEHLKRSADAVAAAKERFLARKKAKVQ